MLQRARKGAADNAYHACGQVLTTFLGQKLDRTMTGLTQNGVARLLKERGVEPELAGRVERCLLFSEMGRYAPGEAYTDSDDLLTETERLVTELDRVL